MPSSTPDRAGGGQNVGPLRTLRHRLGRIALRFTRLWPEIRRFSIDLEEHVLPEARAEGRERICLTVVPGAAGAATGVRPCHAPERLLAYPRVAGFLSLLGIEAIELDVRLESNQIADVLAFLHRSRRALLRCELRRPGGGGGICGLWEPPGLQLFCTNTMIRRRTLVVVYSYCATCMSRLVQWFKRVQRNFSDHRALFAAAPRYAVLVFLIAVVPFVLHVFFPGAWVLPAASAAGALLLAAIVYLFFITTGSLEYDNEEKAHRLRLANRQLAEYARRTGVDLARARTVQQRMLPSLDSMPLADAVDWAFSFVPEAEVGGDYFDVARTGERQAAILFSDVSGHGMSAAFITAIIKTAFQRWVDDGGPMAQFIGRLNSALCRLTPDDSFAAMFLATYEADTGELLYVNCGHNPEAWILPADGGRPIATLSDARATLLGFLEEFPIEQGRRRLAPGDTLLLVTDGIVEARDRQGEFYGTERFEQFLAAHRGRGVSQLTGDIIAEIAAFTQDAPQTDDRTVLAMQVRPKEG